MLMKASNYKHGESKVEYKFWEAIDNVWDNGAWIEGEETRDDYTILIARDDNNRLVPCHFHTLFNRYE